MKKIFTSLFAVAAVFCASAAELPTYTVSPEQETPVADRSNFQVTFTFSEAVSVNEVEFVGGARFNSTISTAPVTMAEASTEVKVTVPDDVWGTPQGGEYLLTVTLPAIYDAAGNQIVITEESEEGETFSYAYTASASYTAPYEVEAEYLGLDPDPATTTVWDVYSEGWGFVNFLFSGEVSLSATSKAEIIFYLYDGDRYTINVSLNDLWADWDWWTGDFAVTVPMSPIEDLEEEDLKAIKVTLSNIENGSSTIANLVADYTLTSTAEYINVKKAPSTAGITLTTTPDIVNVYDVHGNLVMGNTSLSEIKSLASGIYIVNGKKFVIR